MLETLRPAGKVHDIGKMAVAAACTRVFAAGFAFSEQARHLTQRGSRRLARLLGRVHARVGEVQELVEGARRRRVEGGGAE